MREVTHKIFLLSSFLILLSSCEEIVEVELDNADPQIVISAVITEKGHQSSVNVSKSRDFNSEVVFDYKQYERNYKVVIINPNGDSILFTDFDPPYHNWDFVAIPETEYSICVTYNSITYEATSYFPKPISIKELKVKKKKNHITDKSYYELHCFFQDHPGIEDFAKLSVSIKGKRLNQIFTYNDRLTDGNLIDYAEFYFEEEHQIQPGDEITVHLVTIDEINYKYFETLKSAIASSGGIPINQMTPSNPVSNWSNGALGYFSACSRDYKSIVVQDPNTKD